MAGYAILCFAWANPVLMLHKMYIMVTAVNTMTYRVFQGTESITVGVGVDGSFVFLNGSRERRI